MNVKVISSEKPYGLVQNIKTGEIHIFKWHNSENGDFSNKADCICNYEFENNEYKIYEFNTNGIPINKMFEEEEVRFICSKIGKGVCGTCISSFYGTPKDMDKKQIDKKIMEVKTLLNNMHRNFGSAEKFL